TGGAFVLTFALYHVWRAKHPKSDRSMYRTAARIGAVAALIGGAATVITGDIQGKVMTDVQPMKMAAAEGLYHTNAEGEGADFSIITVGTLDGREEVWALTVPNLLSYLATGTLDGTVEGINDLNAQYRVTYSGQEMTELDDYRPIIPVTYWSFRLMIGLGFVAMAAAGAVLWAMGKDRDLHPKWWFSLAIGVLIAPLLANSFGWIFTEMGRQPWVVFGLMPTQSGVSPGVSMTEMVTSLTAFTLLYGALAVVEVKLLIRYGRPGPDPFDGESLDPADREADDAFVFTY